LESKLLFFRALALIFFCFSEKSLKGLKPSQIIFCTLSSIPDLKVRAIGSDLEAVFVQLPCPLGRGFGKQTIIFQGFSPYIFLFF